MATYRETLAEKIKGHAPGGPDLELMIMLEESTAVFAEIADFIRANRYGAKRGWYEMCRAIEEHSLPDPAPTHAPRTAGEKMLEVGRAARRGTVETAVMYISNHNDELEDEVNGWEIIIGCLEQTVRLTDTRELAGDA